jgi:hypothetical protein
VELDSGCGQAYIDGKPITGSVYAICDFDNPPSSSEKIYEQIIKAKKEAERLGIYERVFGKVAETNKMEDKSLFTNSRPRTISEGLQNFIDSMVEEIVLEGKPFDTQKKYLKKFSENEGLDYEKLEADITTFIEILDNLKTAQVKLAEEKGKECHISEETVKKLVKHSLPKKLSKKEESKKDLWIALAVAAVVAVVVVLLWPKKPYKQIDKWMAESERIYSTHHIEEPMDDYTMAIDSLNYGDSLCDIALKAFDEIRDLDSLHMMKRYRCEDLAQSYRSNVEWIVGKELIRLSIADDTLAAIDRLRQLEEFFYYQHDSTGLSQREAIEKDIGILCHAELFEISKNGKVGLYDQLGNMVVEPQFSFVGSFYEGLAAVRVNREWKYINKLGTIVLEPKCGFAYSFHEGLAAVEFDGKYGFIDKLGTMVIEPKFDNAFSFEKGHARVKLNGKWGFIDKQGNTVIEPKYEDIGAFSEGTAKVKLNGKWGFIDKKGNTVIEPKYDDAYWFKEGLAAVKFDGKWGVIDKSGTMVIEPKYDYARSFDVGLAAVKFDGKWGFIDKSGTMVIEPKYDDAYWFKEGLVEVEIDGKWGVIDKLGNIVVELKHDEIVVFREGLAAVKFDGKWGFIDKSGAMVIEPKYEHADGFRGGLAKVSYYGHDYHIDKHGKTIFDF